MISGRKYLLPIEEDFIMYVSYLDDEYKGLPFAQISS